MPNRREFLALGAMAGLRFADAPPIRRIEAFPVRYGVTSYFRFLPKPERPAVFVKVTCEDGTAGWGQSVPSYTWSYETLESVLHATRNQLAPALIGRNPLDIAGAHTAMNRAVPGTFSTGMPVAKAGLDLALHDIAGRLAAKPLPQLWQHQPLEDILLSWTVNVPKLEEAEGLVEAGRKRGYQHFNIKVAPDPEFDVALARTVRKLAPNCFLWADANGGYDAETALKLAPRLADAGVNVFEQPVPSNLLSGYAALKKQGALPIVMDEGVVNSVELLEFIRLDLLDGVAMKPARTAGLADARRQIEIVHQNGLMFLGSGLTDPDVALSASLQLYGAYHLRYPAALNAPQFLAGSFLKQPLVEKNGRLPLPKGPGLGVEVDEQKIRQVSRG
jgi:L-alanine-DL-glutamate epimerase-like enolase superfamily enzyme